MRASWPACVNPLARPITGKMSPQEPIVASTTLPITRLNRTKGAGLEMNPARSRTIGLAHQPLVDGKAPASPIDAETLLFATSTTGTAGGRSPSGGRRGPPGPRAGPDPAATEPLIPPRPDQLIIPRQRARRRP